MGYKIETRPRQSGKTAELARRVADIECTATRHGTRVAYRDGCTHPAARQAHLDYMRAWYRTPAGRAWRARYNVARRIPRPTPAEVARARRVDLACTMYERGASIADIARELGCNRRTVERYISPSYRR